MTNTVDRHGPRVGVGDTRSLEESWPSRNFWTIRLAVEFAPGWVPPVAGAVLSLVLDRAALTLTLARGAAARSPFRLPLTYLGVPATPCRT
jgi:hypothetical protein